jgi:cysteine desulfurase
MLPFLADRFGSPASHYALGRASAEAIEDARGQVAGLLGCDAEEIVFTSGGSESNNLAIKGLAFCKGRAAGGHLIISAIEHASIVEPAQFLERFGFDLTIVPCTGQGVVQPAAVRKAIRADTFLVSVMMANGETGVIQPIRQIAEVCREAGVLLHTDAVQAVGRIRTSVAELDVDLLTLSGHKMHAPAGVGALFVRQGIDLEPLLHGGGQETGLRGGSENVAGIIGLGAAAVLTAKSLDASQDRMQRLSDRLLAALQEGLGDALIIHGKLAPKLPQTLCLSFLGASGRDMLARVPELCASTHASGHSETESISPTLAAMGIASEIAQGTIRLSLGWYTSEEEVDRAASLLIGAWEACSGN